MRHPARKRFVPGLFCIALGAYPLAIAFGLIPVGDTKILAPMWVVALSGVVFLIAGCMILLKDHFWAKDLLALAPAKVFRVAFRCCRIRRT
jgi:predicted branched-subunit amino acid permease